MEKKSLEASVKNLPQILVKSDLKPETTVAARQCPSKLPIFWRSFKFTNKVLFAGSLVYYTYRQGAWGAPEESIKFISKFSQDVHKMTPNYIAAILRDVD